MYTLSKMNGVWKLPIYINGTSCINEKIWDGLWSKLGWFMHE